MNNNLKHFVENNLDISKKYGLSKLEISFLKYLISLTILRENNEFHIKEILMNYYLDVFIFLDKDYKEIYEFLDDEKEEIAIINEHENSIIDLEVSTKGELKARIEEIDYLEKEILTQNYINLIPLVKQLIRKGWLTNTTYFNHNIPNLLFLGGYFNVSKDFLYLIENGKIKDLPTISQDDNYKSYKEFLEDKFTYLDCVLKILSLENFGSTNEGFIYKNLEKRIKEIEQKIESKERNTANFSNFPIFEFSNKHNLNEKETLILIILLKEEIDLNKEMSHVFKYEANILKILDYIFKDKTRIDIFNFDNLTDEQTIIYDVVSTNTNINNVYSLSNFISDQIKPNIVLKEDKKDKKIIIDKIEKINKKNGATFEIIEPDLNLQTVVIDEELKNLISILELQNNKEEKELLEKWGVKKPNEEITSNILFHGKPGTGKTLSAYIIAKKLNKKVLSFDCSKILSMYIGESEKNVRNIFDTYKEIVKETNEYPILLLNEADQFLSSRTNETGSGAEKMHNQMQNIFLEQVEKFNGILIATTNLIKSLDKAFSRRFNKKIEFKVPDFEKRLEIWKRLLPKDDIENIDFEKLSKYELTGGQISLIIKNTAYNVVIREDKVFKQEDLIKEIDIELETTFDKTKKVGFNL